jgi:copper homeostasis protein
MLLEIIASSLPDALEAEQGGAHRLELCVALDVEGLTMPPDLIEAIAQRVRIPWRVMLRETNSYTATREELTRMIETARAAAKLGADGFVIGFATAHDLDANLTAELASSTPLPVTHQRAFEFAPDPFTGIAQLKTLPRIDTLLTNGQQVGETLDWPARAARLEAFRLAAEPEISILAGGGVNADVIRFLREHTGVEQFHCGRPAREDGVVKAHKVAELVRALQ